MTDALLPTAVILLGGLATLTVALFEIALIRGRRVRRQKEKTARLLPEIQKALVAYLAGNRDLDRLREIWKTCPQELSSAILGYRSTVTGSARDSLCSVALELGVVHAWRDDVHSRDPLRRREAFAALAFMSAYEPCYRVTAVILAEALNNPQREVRLVAAQALALYGEPALVVRVFEMATRETLLGRILLAEPLRPHALELCRVAVPVALNSGEPDRVLGALQIVVGWERALPLGGLEVHIAGLNRFIRIEALRAAPLVLPSPQLDAAVTNSLADPDGEIAMAAAGAAARLRIQAALPLLAKCLLGGNAALARTAAAALASMPPLGWKMLDQLAVAGEPVSAAAAAEALGRVPAAGAA